MMTISKRPRRARSYITGEKGNNRVRLYPHPRDGMLMLEYRDESGVKKRASLRHTDFAAGKAAADSLAAELRKTGRVRLADVTLKQLFDSYEREVTPSKGVSAQSHDRRARRLFEACWGDAVVKDLDRRDWDRFIRLRRAGNLRAPGDSRPAIGVRNRVIEQDLRFLLAVCNWAERVRLDGRPLLERNPFKGLPVPTERNPDRPIVSDEELSKLRQAAKQLGPEVELYLTLVQETGHRCSAVGLLRWSDIDLESGQIAWREDRGNKGFEHTAPLSETATEALRATRRAIPRIGDGWVFPSPTDPSQPIRRDLLRDWWQKLERLSGIDRVPGRGWHSLRRKFATDLKGIPMSDLQALGGWRDHNTILKCYIRPDEATMRKALIERSTRRVAGM
jgi:integrase